ncbi:hypothetical protein CHCC20335_4681 [Bacillus paralicheniformis]|uniref:Uncharacterized protein n=1 Tax=Bacillus sonorensis L12 TaxID=1274524 RepID=M5P180_9BACI|nr:hypothetical protein BSONL12_19044 [Bacillus sonorensis L12]TWK83610.1 hypothetical protein CHCC20335_4681 [Bacillus paralicheniformis]
MLIREHHSRIDLQPISDEGEHRVPENVLQCLKQNEKRPDDIRLFFVKGQSESVIKMFSIQLTER